MAVSSIRPAIIFLAEFASVVDAVRCAVEIQQELKVKNAELPDHRQMQFRIGINLGDVIVEGERLYGDGVNIAARLESLAIPGGICISGTVYDQVENKLALTYEYLGEQAVKNIAKPVRMYRVVREEGQVKGPPSQTRQAARLKRKGKELKHVGRAVLAEKGGLVAVAGCCSSRQRFGTVRYFSSPIPNSQPSPLAPKPRQRRCLCPTSPPSSFFPL